MLHNSGRRARARHRTRRANRRRYSARATVERSVVSHATRVSVNVTVGVARRCERSPALHRSAWVSFRGSFAASLAPAVNAVYTMFVRRKRLIHGVLAIFAQLRGRASTALSALTSERRPVTIPALAIRTTVPTVALSSRSCPKRSRDVCLYVRVLCVCAPCVWPWPRPAAPGAWHRAPIS